MMAMRVVVSVGKRRRKKKSATRYVLPRSRPRDLGGAAADGPRRRGWGDLCLSKLAIGHQEMKRSGKTMMQTKSNFGLIIYESTNQI